MKTLLKVESLSGGYAKKKVIEDVSLDIKEGDFLGIIGPNGSGKSTLLRLMTHVLKPWRGKVMFDAKEVRLIPRKDFSRQVGFVSQDAAINFSFTVREMVLMGRIPHLGRLQFETKKDISIAEEAMGLTGVLELKNRAMDELSAGERQRVVIARSLAQQPKLLFLDEPTSHLDIGHQVHCLDLLKKLNRENALTVVIVLHDLNLASEYCDMIALLNDGRIFTEGSPDNVLTYKNIENVYKTVVVVNKNPISSKPYVILVSEAQCRQRSS